MIFVFLISWLKSIWSFTLLCLPPKIPHYLWREVDTGMAKICSRDIKKRKKSWLCVSYGFDGTETHSGILILIHILNYECILKDSGNILYTFVEVFFINTKYLNLTALLEISIEHLILSMISPTTESILLYAM